MNRKTKASKRSRDRAESNTDTSVYGQAQGAAGKEPPNQLQPRMPHERDESARATGNRSDEQLKPSGRIISQAGQDAERGLVDTDRRGVPNDLPTRKST